MCSRRRAPLEPEFFVASATEDDGVLVPPPETEIPATRSLDRSTSTSSENNLPPPLLLVLSRLDDSVRQGQPWLALEGCRHLIESCSNRTTLSTQELTIYVGALRRAMQIAVDRELLDEASDLAKTTLPQMLGHPARQSGLQQFGAHLCRHRRSRTASGNEAEAFEIYQQ